MRLTNETDVDLLKYGQNRVHYFCRHCGVKLFGRRADGTRIAVSVAALDDLDPRELVRIPVRYVNGLHDDFKSEPAFKAHL